jgi:GDPmannose 4,6-dehydratase
MAANRPEKATYRPLAKPGVGRYRREHGAYVHEVAMARTALITGVSGQDGSYLARFLLDKGYRVVGGVRRTSNAPVPRLHELRIAGDVELVDFDLGETANILRALERVKPDEVYNLAAQSYVGRSFEQPLETSETNALGPLRLLEALRRAAPSARFYQASSSEMFGRKQGVSQDETTPFSPRTPYGAAKLFAHVMTVNYRETYGIGASSGILFNHESPLRGREFVTRKITWTLARIRQGEGTVLELGNLDARRDWGFAGDYVEGMWLTLQQDAAQDFVFATGETHSVRDFVGVAAARLGFDLEWQGGGGAEQAIDRRSRRTIVRVDPAFYRPVEVEAMVGNAAKARDILGWRPKVRFADLVGMMAEADERRARDAVAARAGGVGPPGRAFETGV